jgi:hypothetical protein
VPLLSASRGDQHHLQCAHRDEAQSRRRRAPGATPFMCRWHNPASLNLGVGGQGTLRSAVCLLAFRIRCVPQQLPTAPTDHCGTFIGMRILGRLLLLAALVVFVADELAPRGQLFAFEATNSSGQPVGWPSNSTISYQIVTAHEPTDGARLVTHELAYVSLLTGLHFVRKGGAAQVVFAWRPPDHLLGATNVNGVTQPDVDAGRDFFIGALVLFNESEDCAWMTHPEFAENLVLHELGHVLGLADVDNTGEVMNNWLDTGTRISTYQAGDRAGLRVLYGAQPQRRRSLWRRPRDSPFRTRGLSRQLRRHKM